MQETDYQKVELRQLTIEDYHGLKASMQEAYAHWPEISWEEEEVAVLIKKFPEGQFVVTVDDEVAGCALSILVKYSNYGDRHSYKQITGNYTFSTHDPNGDTMYGIDVFIHPKFRGLRLGRRLYDVRKEFVEQNNLIRIIFGGRIPEYHKYKDELSPRQYIEKVKMKEIFDPTLTFQLSNDFSPIKVMKDYLAGDVQSQEYAVLLDWNNIYYESEEQKKESTKSVVRLGLVQWQMRQYENKEQLLKQIEFFVDAVSSYKADFCLFPEFFNAPLMAPYNHLSEADAIRKLAEYTEEIKNHFQQLAISYNVNIITGSMPMMENDKLFNVGFLCKRDGSLDRFEKMHVTPDEVKCWGLSGGNILQTYDTDCGKIGVLICYDVEFPELPRLLADEGMQILFVPFLTDTQNGYSRVRHCALSRAIENECYVAITGSVGNLPNVENMDIQYAQSAIFTPCDFAFPTTGVKAEATPNTEMILVGDVDLSLLKQLHEYGSVRNLKDRRHDQYFVSRRK